MKIYRLREVHLTAGLLLAVVGSSSVLTESLFAAPRPSATMLGSAMVKRKNLGTTTSLQANDKLYPGDVIAANGVAGASVQFADGSRVDMAGRAVLEITSPVSVGHAKTLFRALNGRMAAHLRPGKVVATRCALVRVKGTVILISVEDDGTSTLSVLEGAAEFFNPCGSVIVPAGAESVARPGNRPSDPAAIPDVQALLRNWQNQNDVLAPFVDPNAAPVANQPVGNIIGNQQFGAPTYMVGLPDYLQNAVAKLNAIPPEQSLISISALAQMKQRPNKVNKDCGCGVPKN